MLTFSGMSLVRGLATATRAAACVRTGHSSARVPRCAGGPAVSLTSKKRNSPVASLVKVTRACVRPWVGVELWARRLGGLAGQVGS